MASWRENPEKSGTGTTLPWIVRMLRRLSPLDFPDCQINPFFKNVGLTRGPNHPRTFDHNFRREYQTNIGLMALDVNVYADKKDYRAWTEVSDAGEGKDDFVPFNKEK